MTMVSQRRGAGAGGGGGALHASGSDAFVGVAGAGFNGLSDCIQPVAESSAAVRNHALLMETKVARRRGTRCTLQPERLVHWFIRSTKDRIRRLRKVGNASEPVHGGAPALPELPSL